MGVGRLNVRTLVQRKIYNSRATRAEHHIIGTLGRVLLSVVCRGYIVAIYTTIPMDVKYSVICNKRIYVCSARESNGHVFMGLSCGLVVACMLMARAA